MKIKIWHAVLSVSLLMACNLPDFDALDNVKVENEGKYAFPIPGFTYDDIGDFFTLHNFSKQFGGALVLKTGVNLPSGIRFPEDQTLELANLNEKINFQDFFDALGSSPEIKEVVFKSGTLTLSLQTNLTLDLTISTPNLVDAQDNAYTDSVRIDGTDNSIVISLKDKKLQLTDGSFQFTLKGSVVFKKGDSIPNGISVKPGIAITNATFDIVKGYFGQFTHNFDEQTIDLSNVIGGDKELQYGSNGYVVGFSIVNPLGVPFQIDLSQLEFIDEDEKSYFLQNQAGNVFDITPATLGADGTVEEGTTLIEFSSENSNIDELFQHTIKTIKIRPIVKINPEGKTSVDNFVKTGTKAEFNGRIQMALKIKI